MVYIKNITETNLFIPDFGINLLPNEIRDISEFSNRQKLQDYSDVFIDLLNVNKIFLLDADLNVMKTSIAVKYICNAYDIIKVDSNLNNKFYYFLKDNFELNRNSIVDKHFIGRVKTLYILSDSTDIIVSIESGNGLKMHDETLIKRQTLELSFDSDIEDICVSLKIPESAGVKTSVEIFIDGFASIDKSELQTFIDTWKENQSEIGKYNGAVLIKKENISASLNSGVLEIQGNKNDYSIYKNNNDVIVEKLTDNKWKRFNRSYVKAKKISSIKFSDGSVILSTITKTKNDHINAEGL